MPNQKISELTSGTPTTSDTWVMVQWWVNKKFTLWDLPISTATQTQLDNKVNKVTWKGLSTNDYDNTEKAKVDWAVQTIVAGTNVTVSRVWNSVTINSTWWGGGGWWAVDSVNWQTWVVVLDTDDISEGITNKYLSATDKTDLTDGWDSTLHYHASDRNRANHTWTQTMSTISDAWNLATLNSVDEDQIVNQAVTNTKLANMNSNTLKGRLSWNGTPQDVAMADLPISTATQTALNWKQETLVSWTNIKTVNWTSLLWSWNIEISGGGWWPIQHRITIPWEQVADTANYQGLYWYNDTWVTKTISNVAFAVWKAAAWTWAAAAYNIYKSSGTEADWLNTNAVALFSSAVNLWTWYTSLTNTPNTTTVEAGRWVSLRCTSSAWSTNRASDLQCIITFA
jgi:hypothetical protein